MMLAPTAGLDEAALVKGLTEDPLSFTKNLKDQLGDFFLLTLVALKLPS